jgi:hypothetical protein
MDYSLDRRPHILGTNNLKAENLGHMFGDIAAIHTRDKNLTLVVEEEHATEHHGGPLLRSTPAFSRRRHCHTNDEVPQF